MPVLPKATPILTQPIEHFIVKFKDGTVMKVEVGEGNGYYREEQFIGETAGFMTYQCFVSKGLSKTIPSYGHKRLHDSTESDSMDQSSDLRPGGIG
jgi:hypothetical protein